MDRKLVKIQQGIDNMLMEEEEMLTEMERKKKKKNTSDKGKEKEKSENVDEAADADAEGSMLVDGDIDMGS